MRKNNKINKLHLHTDTIRILTGALAMARGGADNNISVKIPCISYHCPEATAQESCRETCTCPSIPILCGPASGAC